MGEICDFENEFGNLYAYLQHADSKEKNNSKKVVFTMTISKEMKQQIKELGGAPGLKKIVHQEYKKLKGL